MKAKSIRAKARAKSIFVLACLVVVAITVAAKGKEPEIIGYRYDSGDTVWEMASRHCPNNMDIREFVREIEEVNGIENAIVYKGRNYKIPVYKTESDYLDLNTIVGYETSDDGLMLFTNDGNGYFIER